jgi:hypothetical protein
MGDVALPSPSPSAAAIGPLRAHDDPLQDPVGDRRHQHHAVIAVGIGAVVLAHPASLKVRTTARKQMSWPWDATGDVPHGVQHVVVVVQ